MSEDVRPIETLRDELKLQAWLARAEFRNPSLRQEAFGLAQVRDELRVQLHLGKMEARDEFDALEARWLDLKNRVNTATEPVVDDVRALLKDIREGYRIIRGD